MKTSLSAILLYGVLATVCIPASAQTTPRAFDITLVKENSGTPQSALREGREALTQNHNRGCSQSGRFTQRGYAAVTTIYFAYEIQDIVGGPDWLKRQFFDMDGQNDQATTQQECVLMVRELLQTRFKLAFHWETRQIPVYNLVIAKSGSKLRPASGRGARINGSIFHVDGMEMAAFRGTLAAATFNHGPRPIVDHTGLTGKYDFVLDYSFRPEDGKADIFTAVQEQLGLKLEPGEETRQVMVVDHIERPDPN
ncbi:MAG: TIGR03435 family protein [Acidobacteriota bacterium]